MMKQACAAWALASMLGALTMAGCLDRQLAPLNPCLVSGVSRQVQVKNVDKVDLLFMIDNSNSMALKQGRLKDQFPKVIKVLTSGMRTPDDMNPFPPAKDLHVGIVTSDLGIAGVEFGNCHADGGDDGRLQHTPHGDNCDPTYPLFLSYNGDSKVGPVTDQVKFANDFLCIAAVGTGGCGDEQQLEAPLKALWPSVYTDANGNVVNPNPIQFLATTPQGKLGKGDVPAAQGGNLGFLRNDPAQGLSLIAIVVVTDEEDCSVRSTEHFWPPNLYPDDSPYKNEDINLRCFYNPQFMFDVMNRYYKGYRGLRPGNENLVVFAAITGVPQDDVDQATLDKTDFSDQTQRDAFYNNILNDPRMVIEIDPATMPGSGNGNIRFSCSRPLPDGELEVATPPRRIVQLAQMFGENGIVQSICQDDYGPAMGAIINIIAKQLGQVCLPRPLVRERNGKVSCNVVWELPKVALPGSGTPTDCSQEVFLGPVDSGGAPMNSAGGNNCKVTQLPVMGTDITAKNAPTGSGWYYDDYTSDLIKTCPKAQPQRVAFTSDAKPPTGVTVKLECLNETQKLMSTRSDLSQATAQPGIGSACGTGPGVTVSGDAACIQTTMTGQQITEMFCHPTLNTCVKKCTTDTDCPPAWVCDSRPETLAVTGSEGAYCVNPTCGADTTDTTN